MTVVADPSLLRGVSAILKREISEVLHGEATGWRVKSNAITKSRHNFVAPGGKTNNDTVDKS